jgi:hypothetical protein
MQNILPPMVKWLEGFYKVLRGSVDPQDNMELSVRFSEAELVKTARYNLLVQSVAQMHARPAGSTSAPPAAAAISPVSPIGFQKVIGGKEQCRHCHSLGKVPPATNHPMKGCNKLLKELGGSRKRGRDEHGKGGKGGKHGKGGKGKGGKGKK